MRGVSVSRCCDGRRRRNRKSISWCHRGDFTATVGVAQTDPPRSPQIPLCIPWGSWGDLAGGTEASWLLAEQPLQAQGRWPGREQVPSDVPLPAVSPCPSSCPHPHSTSVSRGVGGV